jgi:hypothetical protein
MPIVRVSDPSGQSAAGTLWVEAVVRRAFHLAFVACGGPTGMGFLQDRGPNVTEDQVWENVQTRGDYPANPNSRPDRAYGDYVFGRMMKLSVTYSQKDGTIQIRDDEPRYDYQGWCRKYPTYAALFEAAASQLGVTLADVSTEADVV